MHPLPAPTFHRVSVQNPRHIGQTNFQTNTTYTNNHPHPSTLDQPQSAIQPQPRTVQCLACDKVHILGSCPLKIAGHEYCNLCGIAHYGYARLCPHINSETQVREMLAAIKKSPEAGHLKSAALKYLTGVKGTLVQKKKRDLERAREGMMGGVSGRASVDGAVDPDVNARPVTVTGGVLDSFYRNAQALLMAGLGRPG